MKSWFIILSCFLLAACTGDGIDRKKIVLKTLEEKQTVYKGKMTEKCFDEFFEEINLEVDSIMFFLGEKMKGNTDQMPARPDRPGRLVDTITLEKKPED